MKISGAALPAVILCSLQLQAEIRPVAAFSLSNPDAKPGSAKTSTKKQGGDILPDYGKTSIEIDQHKLEKKSRNSKGIKVKSDDDDDNKWRRRELFGQSIVEQTKEEMSANPEFQETLEKLQNVGLKGMSKEERTKRRRALDSLGVPPFNLFLAQKEKEGENMNSKLEPKILQRSDCQVLQLNVGLYCNQACAHCHVESSPLRTEAMTLDVAAQCIQLLKNTPSVHTLDITGGAPELNPSFRYIVAMAREIRPDLDIIDRCNLTVLQEPGQGDLVEFLVKHDVHVVASLPCYSADNVDKQRGNGVFDRSISALLALNDAGYGKNHGEGHGLLLDLVYNPLGAFLPPPQQDLEVQYKKQLRQNFDIEFNSLYTMTNIPVKRFTDFLYKRGELEDYMDLLVRNFNPSTLDNLMCTNTISVGYDGKVYDCDFNQQLGYTIGSSSASLLFEDGDGVVDNVSDDMGGKSVFDVETLNDLGCDAIRNDNHCFGCTAGMGSS